VKERQKLTNLIVQARFKCWIINQNRTAVDGLDEETFIDGFSFLFSVNKLVQSEANESDGHHRTLLPLFQFLVADTRRDLRSEFQIQSTDVAIMEVEFRGLSDVVLEKSFFE